MSVSRVFKVSFKGVFKASFKGVSKVLKGSFMGFKLFFVFFEVIAATRAYGGLVWLKSLVEENYLVGSTLGLGGLIVILMLLLSLILM